MNITTEELQKLLDAATPGPWAVHSMFKEYVVPRDAVAKPIGGSVYDSQDRDYYAQTIVRVVPDRHGRGDAAANAHLIAAAPDMYAVLAAAPGDSAHITEWDAWREIASAALAKARGQA